MILRPKEESTTKKDVPDLLPGSPGYKSKTTDTTIPLTPPKSIVTKNHVKVSKTRIVVWRSFNKRNEKING